MKKAILQLCLSIAFTVSTAIAGAAQESSSEAADQKRTALSFNAEAVKQMNQGKHDAAVELLRRAIRLRPDFAIAYFNLGEKQLSLAGLDAKLIEHHRRRWSLIAPRESAVSLAAGV